MLSDLYENAVEYTTLFSVFYASVISYLIFRRQKLHFGEHFIINAVATIGSTIVITAFFPLLKLTNGNNYVLLLSYGAGVGFYYMAFFWFFKPFCRSKFRLILRIVNCALLGIIADILFILFLFVLSSWV